MIGASTSTAGGSGDSPTGDSTMGSSTMGASTDGTSSVSVGSDPAAGASSADVPAASPVPLGPYVDVCAPPELATFMVGASVPVLAVGEVGEVGDDVDVSFGWLVPRQPSILDERDIGEPDELGLIGEDLIAAMAREPESEIAASLRLDHPNQYDDEEIGLGSHRRLPHRMSVVDRREIGIVGGE